MFKGRTAILVLNVIAVLASLLTGMRILPGPDIVGIALAFYTLFILPGFILNRMLMKTIEFSLEVVCRVFFTGLVFVSLLVCMGFAPGVSLAAISITGSGITIALLLIDYYRRPAGEIGYEGHIRLGRAGEDLSRAGRILLLVLLFSTCFVFFYRSGEIGVHSDSLDHISFIRRSLDTGNIFPNDSFYREGDGVVFDPRKGLWHPVMSLWAYQADAPVDYFWRVVPSFLVFSALASFVFFARELLGNVWFVALATLFLLLFTRGEGIRWFTKIAFSRNAAQVVLWAEFAFLVRYYRGKGSGQIVMALLLTLIGAAFHIIFSFLLGILMAGVFIYAAFFPDGKKWRRRFWISVPLQLAAAALPLSLRAGFTLGKFNFLHTHRQGMIFISENLAVVDPFEIISRMGISFLFALFLAPFVFFIAPDRKNGNLVATLFLLPAVLVLNPLSASLLEKQLGYLHYRLLYAAPLVCLLVLAVTGLFRILLSGGTGRRRTAPAGRYSVVGEPRNIHSSVFKSHARVSWYDRLAGLFYGIAKRLVAAGVIAVFILFPLRFAVHGFSGSLRHILDERGAVGENYGSLFEMLDSGIPAHSVIVSDPLTSYLISAFTDQFVTVTLDQHCSPADTSAMSRNEEVRDLFNPAAAISESVNWLSRSGADYILVNNMLPDHSEFFGSVVHGELSSTCRKFKDCKVLVKEIPAPSGFFLFEVRREFLYAGGQACSTRTVYPSRCDGIPGDSLGEIEGGHRSAGGEEDAETGYLMDSQGLSSGRRKIALGTGLDVGCGLVLESAVLSGGTIRAGDTLSGWFCWRVARRVSFGLPLEWSFRIDTDYPKGAFYRSWYAKQYRRRIERRNNILYRFTRLQRLVGGFTFPDQWEVGERVRQDFSFVLPRRLAPGTYEMRLKVRRVTYLPNRSVSDYLHNEDSLHGELVAELRIRDRESKP